MFRALVARPGWRSCGASQPAIASQPLDWPDLRWLLRDPAHGTGHPQVIIRLGQLLHAEVSVVADVQPEDPVNALVRESREAALVVLGPRGRGAVLHCAPCPVAAVPDTR
ncbi:hypothetical protein ACFWOJ_19405 [Streptomyces sp. NPDC058439]|uniref:hypothetical protein n=1 Tax=Streptomyces sp. NPDC058439 TaxID=3346500 RepID=UPI00366623AD